MKTDSVCKLAFVKRRLFLIHCIAITLSIAGCRNKGNLTESKAEELITTLYPIPKTANVQLSNISFSPGIPQSVKFLESKGLATYRYIPPGEVGYGCYGQLTDAGNKYLDHVVSKEYVSMVIARMGFDKITGIREIPQANAAEVEYTEKVAEITPVGEMYTDLALGQTSTKKAVFVKYEDGWRLQQ